MALEVGSRLAHYDVTALIGEGGMGQVYRATDTKLNRQVALKILPEAFAADPDRLARFQREAQVLASLNHPNIAAIYGLEEADPSTLRAGSGSTGSGQVPSTGSGQATRALVLELVEGPTLADRIAQGAIPVDEALPIAKQIAEALEAAHEAGVIHRDLKPANIKVKDDGTVKVLDFGLAKALDPTPDADPSQSPTLTAAATQMGVIMGTAAYMSPEQAKGRPVDKRGDVWAFGAVLYEMLSGQRAFAGSEVSEVLASVLAREPDWALLPRTVSPVLDTYLRRCLHKDPKQRVHDIADALLPRTVSPVLDTYLRRCLHKDPKQRVHDIADVRLALEGAFETSVGAPTEATATPQLQVWQRPIPAAIVALGIAAIAGIAVWSLTRPAPPRVVRFPIPVAADQAFSDAIRGVVAISPDGSQVVYTANNSLWLRPVDQLQAVQVPGTERSFAPFFSADGQSIGFWAAAGQLKKVAVSGAPPVTVADVGFPPFEASWGADDMILYGQREGIMLVPSTSGTPELLIPAGEGEFLIGPQMLPGDEWVLFTVRAANQASWDEAQIVAQSVTTGERTVLIDGGRAGRYLPTGHLVYVLRTVLFAVPLDVDSLEVIGEPVPIVEGVRETIGEAGGAQFSVSATGSLVYAPGTVGGDDKASLVWVDRDGDEERFPAPPRSYGHPRVSPDGTRVAVDIANGDNTDVWIWDLERKTLTQFTFDEGVDNFPLWTPDSARVVFASSRDDGGLFWKA